MAAGRQGCFSQSDCLQLQTYNECNLIHAALSSGMMDNLWRQVQDERLQSMLTSSQLLAAICEIKVTRIGFLFYVFSFSHLRLW